MNRRKFLGIGSGVIMTIGGVVASMPFFKSWNTRKGRFHDFDVTVDISSLKVGSQMQVEWMGKPVLIYRRTKEELSDLRQITDELRDEHSLASIQPTGTDNNYRSIYPDIMVVSPLCTHLGCAAPKYSKDSPEWLGDDWKGGFYCPCHGSKFDLAGRVYKDVPAPTNMEIPPYTFIGENTLVIGAEHKL